jgi:hypothetical protein
MTKDLKNKIKDIIKKHKKSFTWEKPSKDEEKNEFSRYPKKYWNKFEAGRLVDLDEKTWSNLKNTDSYSIKDIDHAKELANIYKRDIESILKADKLPAPIVVEKNKEYELVSGNTRLMVARALKIKPKIWLIEI